MKVSGVFRNEGEEATWVETHDFPNFDHKAIDAKAKARELLVDMIERYNQRRRDNEKKREVIKGRIIGASTEHQWEKTNLVTIKKAGRMYDTVRCKHCGATGKRYGVSGPVPDRKTQWKCKKGI